MLDPKKIYLKLKTKNVPILVLAMSFALAAAALATSFLLHTLGMNTVGSGSEYFAMARALQSKASTLVVLGILGAAVVWLVIKRTQKKEQ